MTVWSRFGDHPAVTPEVSDASCLRICRQIGINLQTVDGGGVGGMARFCQLCLTSVTSRAQDVRGVIKTRTGRDLSASSLGVGI